MGKIVVKFGGSNFKNKEDVAKLLKIIGAYGEPIVIVVSAFYGITDFLISSINRVSKREMDAENVLSKLFEVSKGVIDTLIAEESIKDEIYDRLRERISELKKYLMGIHYLEEIPDFVYDSVLSYGERISSLVFSAILKEHGFSCEEKLPEEIGLLTDGEFGNATVDLVKSEKNVKENLSGETIYVIPGFYGVSEVGKVTLLGRGGSDYSASAIAYCINAKYLDVWKDVPGFMSGDPKIIKSSITISRLTYTEVAELSYFGAKILHQRTVEPVMFKKIPIRVLDISGFKGEIRPVTIIGDEGYVKKAVVKSVTYTHDVGVIQLIGPGVGIKPGILAKVTSALNKSKINIKSVITSQTCIDILFDKSDLEAAYRVLKGLDLHAVDEIAVLDNICLIAAVGEGMLEYPGVASRIFSAVAREGINVLIISTGASSVAIYFAIDKKDYEKAVLAVHREFFGK